MISRATKSSKFITASFELAQRILLAGFCCLALAQVSSAGELLSKLTDSPADQEQGFVPLLGIDAAKLWRSYKEESWPKNWELQDGVLMRRANGGDIVTVEQFADFELRLEWKISKGGNSGIIYRVSLDKQNAYYSGIECQVLDDENHRDGKNPKTTASSIYGLYARDTNVKAPFGEWNKVRIIVAGKHIEHWLNGKKVVECEVGSGDWNARVAESKFATWPKFAKNQQGHIVLQDHYDPVWYRNIRIKRLGVANETPGQKYSR